jgi:hypothetical protein
VQRAHFAKVLTQGLDHRQRERCDAFLPVLRLPEMVTLLSARVLPAGPIAFHAAFTHPAR